MSEGFWVLVVVILTGFFVFQTFLRIRTMNNITSTLDSQHKAILSILDTLESHYKTISNLLAWENIHMESHEALEVLMSLRKEI